MSEQQRVLYAVTGLSGAGISTALEALEDLGIFSIDNLPPPLLPKLLELAAEGERFQHLAVGLDGRNLIDAAQTLKRLQRLALEQNRLLRVLFLEANEDALLRRFSTSRRPHPLAREGRSLRDALEEERRLTAPLRDAAHMLIDSSTLTVHSCRQRVQSFASTDPERRLSIQLMSFGFRHGVPAEADLLWDVRFLPNPHFEVELKPLSGLDEGVQNFVYHRAVTQRFLDRFLPLLLESLPAYQEEGKSYLTIAIGCTGGRHRSVALIEAIAEALQAEGWPSTRRHRDIDKAY